MSDTQITDTEYIQGEAADDTVIINLDDYATSLSLDNDGTIYGYYVTVGNDKVYFPKDKIQYLSKAEDDTIINLSSSTITCYALTSNGVVGSQYRLPAFGKMQKYTYYSNNYNSWWQWDSVSALASDSNITFGNTGVSNNTDFLLVCILLVLGVGLLIRKKG